MSECIRSVALDYSDSGQSIDAICLDHITLSKLRTILFED